MPDPGELRQEECLGVAQVDQGLLTLRHQAASPRMQIFGLEWYQEVLEEHVRLQTWA